jgi:hypothetical protein
MHYIDFKHSSLGKFPTKQQWSPHVRKENQAPGGQGAFSGSRQSRIIEAMTNVGFPMIRTVPRHCDILIKNMKYLHGQDSYGVSVITHRESKPSTKVRSGQAISG